MECYYIVISSSHLSKGHFRNIKGVFRGPLTGSKTLDNAEKEQTRANALEDLKANFYCELCDKQYYKHQEFDNHINSYDHAHKQRLKELKQREFARNVASKLRKDERKQKKYLQRLHRLADLKREAACAPGSGPMFKSTTVTVRNHEHTNLQNALDLSVEKDPHTSSQRHNDNRGMMSIHLESSESKQTAKQKCDDQIKNDKHKISFSFTIHKKAPIKLESSAAVFYEFSDDPTSDNGLKKRSRLVPESSNASSTLSVDVHQCSNEDQKSISIVTNQSSNRNKKPQPSFPADLPFCSSEETQLTPILVKHSSDKRYATQNKDQKPQLTSPKDVPSFSSVDRYVTPPLSKPSSDICAFTDCDICQLNVPCNTGVPASPFESETTTSVDEPRKKEMSMICNQTEITKMQPSTGEVHCESFNSLEQTQQNENTVLNELKCSTQELRENVSNSLLTSCDDMGASNIKINDLPLKRPSDAFHPVQSKDGSTVLQWPSEMCMFTYTEPSISYSCNPLHFDFRTLKKPNYKEHSKHIQCYQGNESLYQATEKLADKCDIKEHNKSKPDCTTDRSQFSKDPLNKRNEFSEINANLQSNNVTINIKEDNKHISKCYLDAVYDVNTKHKRKKLDRNKNRFHKCGKRKCIRKHSSEGEVNTIPNSRSGHRGSNSADNNAVLKGSVCSLTQLTLSKQLPDSEDGHRERGLVSMHSSQIKTECRIWNDKTDDDHFENENTNTMSLNNQSKVLNHKSENKMYSNEFSKWSSAQIHFNPQEPETFEKRRCILKREHTSSVHEELPFKKRKLYKPCSSSVQKICPEKNYFVLWNPIQGASVDKETEDNVTRKSPCYKFLTQTNYKLHKKPFSSEYLHKLEKLKQAVENKLDQLWKSLLYLKYENESQSFSTVKIPEKFKIITNRATKTKNKKDILSLAKNNTSVEQNTKFDSEMSYFPHSNNTSQHCILKSSLSDKLARDEYKESRGKCINYNSHVFTNQSLPFKETDKNNHTRIAEKFLSRVAHSHQRTLFPRTYSVKHHHCGTYNHVLQPNKYPRKLKIVFPTIAVQSYASLYPVQLEQPFFSTPAAIIHHTVRATSVDTGELIDLQQQSFSTQAQAFTRTPLYQITVEPRLCPVDTFFSSPQIPIIPSSVLHHVPLHLPIFSHTTGFPPPDLPHPSLIPLQHLF